MEDEEGEQEVKASFSVPRNQNLPDEDIDDLSEYDEDAEDEIEEIVRS